MPPYGAEMTAAAIDERNAAKNTAHCSAVAVDESGDFTECGVAVSEAIQFDVTAYLRKIGQTKCYMHCTFHKVHPLKSRQKRGLGGTITIGS